MISLRGLQGHVRRRIKEYMFLLGGGGDLPEAATEIAS